MAKTKGMKVFIVHEFRIDDYETRWQYYHVFHFEQNALNKLKEIKEQDMMPIVDDEGFEISCDSPRHFEAGYEGDYSRGMVFVRVIEETMSDYIVGT